MYVECMVLRRGVYRISEGKAKGKKPLAILRRR